MEWFHLTHDQVVAVIVFVARSLDDNESSLSSAHQSELESRLARLKQKRREEMTWAALKVELEQRLT